MAKGAVARQTGTHIVVVGIEAEDVAVLPGHGPSSVVAAQTLRTIRMERIKTRCAGQPAHLVVFLESNTQARRRRGRLMDGAAYRSGALKSRDGGGRPGPGSLPLTARNPG